MGRRVDENPKPFIRTKAVDDILTSIDRYL